MTKELDAFEHQQVLYNFLIATGNSQEARESYSLTRILQFISDNYDSLHAVDKEDQQSGCNFPEAPLKIADALQMIHFALKLSIESNAKPHPEISRFLRTLLKDHPGKEEVLLFLLYQVMNTLSASDVDTATLPIETDIFDELIALVWSTESNRVIEKSMFANIILCLQFYIKKFNARTVAEKLWNLVEGELKQRLPVSRAVCMALMSSLFDEFSLYAKNFYCKEEFIRFVEELLLSESRDERRTGSFLLKKTVNAILEQPDKSVHHWVVGNADEFSNFWCSYVTILDNLEENQSHLILPSLEQLKNIDGEQKQIRKKWIKLLYSQILKHKNILVRRWILEYLMEDTERFTIVNDNDFLENLLNAINCSSLYNLEGYYFSNTLGDNFLKSVDFQDFITAFIEINWKPVPMHFWMNALSKNYSLKNELTSIDKLCKLVGRIEALQNVDIRRALLKSFQEFFSSSICDLDLKSYVNFYARAFKSSDCLSFHNQFFEKLNSTSPMPIDLEFNKRFYELLSASYFREPPNCDRHMECLRILEKIPNDHHAWLRFFVVDLFIFFLDNANYHQSAYLKEFCEKNYQLHFDLNELQTFQEIHDELLNRLSCDKSEADEIKLIYRKAVDIYVSCMKLRYDQDKTIKYPEFSNEILNSSTDLSKHRLVNLLTLQTQSDEINEFLLNIVANQNDFNININITIRIFEYFHKQMPADDRSKFWMQKLKPILIKKRIYNEEILGILSNDELLENVMFGVAKLGDARVEDVYVSTVIKSVENNFSIREAHLLYLKKQTKAKRLLETLIERNNELSRKKPRHYLNSTEHRLKLRIAIVIYEIINEILKSKEGFCDLNDLNLNLFDCFWSILMEQNNQLNITYIYERLTSMIAGNSKAILAKIKEKTQQDRKCQTKQEASMIAVLYQYAIRHQNQLKEDEMLDIIEILLPMTMGANLQTRVYAQLALYAFSNFEISKSENSLALSFRLIKNSIEAIIGIDKITELMNDGHFFNYCANEYSFLDEIAYITEIPYDEWRTTTTTTTTTLDSRYNYLNKAREMFRKKLPSLLAKEEQTPRIDINDLSLGNQQKSETGKNVQRKLNPSCEVLRQSNLLSYPANKNNEIYVVASLIDKLPNLGGLCRTCEVLGINNFVMNSKSSTQKDEFKHLSMTAEKTLNIIEVKIHDLPAFLFEKQSEGFQVIGAEQTSNSISFVDFKYPKKTVLLLGHEKEGIPPNLLSFLDYAVEIPQFGLVRSLNVHVTGALFMWEYCKQHIITK